MVLVRGCGRGPFLQPLHVAGLAEQAVLQRVAAVAVFVVELQATVLGEAEVSSEGCQADDTKATVPASGGVMVQGR